MLMNILQVEDASFPSNSSPVMCRRVCGEGGEREKDGQWRGVYERSRAI